MHKGYVQLPKPRAAYHFEAFSHKYKLSTWGPMRKKVNALLFVSPKKNRSYLRDVWRGGQWRTCGILGVGHTFYWGTLTWLCWFFNVWGALMRWPALPPWKKFVLCSESLLVSVRQSSSLQRPAHKSSLGSSPGSLPTPPHLRRLAWSWLECTTPLFILLGVPCGDAHPIRAKYTSI